MDIGPLPEPFGVPEWSEDRPTSYGLHPGPDVTIPYGLPVRCEELSPNRQIVIGPSGVHSDRMVDGEELVAVLAHLHMTAEDVFDHIDSGPILVTVLEKAEHCAVGNWSGIRVVLVDRGRRRVSPLDLIDNSGLRRRVKPNETLVLPRDVSWSGFAQWVFAVGAPETRVMLTSDFEASELDALIDSGGGSAAFWNGIEPDTASLPTATEVSIVHEGELIAEFDSAGRLVHASGEVLATIRDGVIVTSVAHAQSRLNRTGVFESAIVGDAAEGLSFGWRLDADELYHRDLLVGVVEGDLNMHQRQMVLLGFSHRVVAHVGWRHSTAAVDGMLGDNASWGVDGVEFDGAVLAFDEVVEETPWGIRCYSAPKSTSYADVDSASLALTIDGARPESFESYPRRELSLESPIVRAACVRAARIGRMRGTLGGVASPVSVALEDAQPLDSPRPAYPDRALRLDLGPAECIAEIIVDVTGHPTVETVKGCSIPFQNSVRSTVEERWTFESTPNRSHRLRISEAFAFEP